MFGRYETSFLLDRYNYIIQGDIMDLQTKLSILSSAAKYDVSCSSSGSSRKNNSQGLGNAHMSGICHSWSSDGRCISLLKILLTNQCVYDCTYCVNKVSNDVPRALFTPDEVVNTTINFYKRNYIEGLFLSSAVFKNPDHTMELLLDVVRKLRLVHKFNGYIHLKAIPGASFRLIEEAGRFADRMSVNIELPSSSGLKLLAPQKTRESILKPMELMDYNITRIGEEKKKYKSAPSFLPAGQTTQLMVGATPDHDLKILMLSESLYNHFNLKRVYYSAYVPVLNSPNLPVISKPPLLREHRLYQADWLLRFYGFNASELLDENHQDFDLVLDPKCDWAVRNIHLFPVEINSADYSTLLRVPGIGVLSAQKIVSARKVGALDYDNLKKFGVVLKRARHFITCKGRYYGEFNMDQTLIRQTLITKPPVNDYSYPEVVQLSIFSYLNEVSLSM